MPSLYIHIPFCKSKCLYCGFVSFAGEDDLIGSYLEALRCEAENYRGAFVDTVYIGGGTPSYLNAAQLKNLFSIIHTAFNVRPGAEFTLEANPATFDLEKAKILAGLGVNRVSLGLQSLRDQNLGWLRRPHSSSAGLAAYDILRQAGFDNINVDLICSLPGQDDEAVRGEIADFMALGSEHISVYTLSVPQDSVFYQENIQPGDQEMQARHYALTTELLPAGGLAQYEVSNFAKGGFVCRHNLNYWRGGNYIGLGAGAHAHLDGCRSWNTSGLKSYIAMMENKNSARAGEEKLEDKERFIESFLIGLRLSEGVDLDDLGRRFKQELAQETRQELDFFIGHGLLSSQGGRIRASGSGFLVLDELCARLI